MERSSAEALLAYVAACATCFKANSSQFLPFPARTGGRPNLESSLMCPLGHVLVYTPGWFAVAALLRAANCFCSCTTCAFSWSLSCREISRLPLARLSPTGNSAAE
eukprot:4010160-Amphidinium_carterae.1